MPALPPISQMNANSEGEDNVGQDGSGFGHSLSDMNPPFTSELLKSLLGNNYQIPGVREQQSSQMSTGLPAAPQQPKKPSSSGAQGQAESNAVVGATTKIPAVRKAGWRKYGQKRLSDDRVRRPIVLQLPSDRIVPHVCYGLAPSTSGCQFV